MHQVKVFEEKNTQVLFDLIQNHRLGTLVTSFEGELDANHIPFEVIEQPNSFGLLRAHIAKANPLYQQLLEHKDTSVLVIFQSDNAYISPNWYPEKVIHHKVVPTWNYMVVHIKGKLRLIEDQEQLLEILKNLTHQEEAKLSQTTPWQVSDAPQDYLDQMLKYIVGIEVEITEMTGKFKISQNKNAETISTVQQALATTHPIMSSKMKG
ncbi:FMN-binding negative transcriptional regulator [Acinetobacter sp.]|uniref:FMN-binding negative transcriptional regulator n=1 Tax=Acinetobacter sp. TaxID=472 RepID=UPI0031DFCAC2